MPRSDISKDDINRYDANGQTPLIEAVSARPPDMNEINYLLKQGAIPNFCDNNGNSPLHIAVIRGHREVAELLLKYDANPDLLNVDGKTPKMYAEQDHPDIVNIFPQSKGIPKAFAFFWEILYPKEEASAQTWIKDILIEFDHDIFQGYCHAYSNMVNQAIQANDIETFVERIKLFIHYQ